MGRTERTHSERSPLCTSTSVKTILPDRRIIGIFDLDKCSYGQAHPGVPGGCGKRGRGADVSGEIPKSFVVCDPPYHRQIVYLSQLNSSTL